MKRFCFLFCLLLTIFSFPACGGDDSDNLPPSQEQPEDAGDNGNTDPSVSTPGENGKCLVVFVSRTGTTERVARQIRTALDCDMLEVEPQAAYESDYNAMLERAQSELAAIRQGNYPFIKTSVENFDGYDWVFVGYPIWHGSALLTVSGSSDIQVFVSSRTYGTHELHRAVVVGHGNFLWNRLWLRSGYGARLHSVCGHSGFFA